MGHSRVEFYSVINAAPHIPTRYSWKCPCGAESTSSTDGKKVRADGAAHAARHKHVPGCIPCERGVCRKH